MVCPRGALPACPVTPSRPQQVQLGPRPAVCREAPVTEQEWGQHVDPEGRITHLDGLKRRIFAGVRAGPVGGAGPVGDSCAWELGPWREGAQAGRRG
ncbi:hypothetical protein KIL84_001912 [Mauremys mutica]|uniref:Uncharacterized protein n=1 Tax=Mauremys mutica TaxID=74926 RepID=A0A9D3XJB5_9SAUR|nr:hypothetical protein KIL84_001912 [Mauremys mutica]